MFRMPDQLLSVHKWIQSVAKSPQTATHPGTVAQMARNMETFQREAVKFLPFSALHAPAAPRTAGLRATLLGANRETGTSPWDASRPALIVGIRPSLVQLTTGGAGTAGIDDIDVDLTVDERDRLTSSRDASAGLLQTGWVSLGALAVQTPRLMLLDLNNSAPRLNFNFRWSDPGLNRYHDTIVKVDLFLIYHDDASQNYQGGLPRCRFEAPTEAPPP